MEALIEHTIIQYFWEVLKPSIKAKINQCRRELDSFEELVKKAVKAEAKVALQPKLYAYKIDHCCFWGTCPAYNAKVQSFLKDFKPKNPKFKS